MRKYDSKYNSLAFIVVLSLFLLGVVAAVYLARDVKSNLDVQAYHRRQILDAIEPHKQDVAP